MGKNRLEAFSDGGIAIIITIMILELQVVHDSGVEAFRPLIPVFPGCILSFFISRHLLEKPPHAALLPGGGRLEKDEKGYIRKVKRLIDYERHPHA